MTVYTTIVRAAAAAAVAFPMLMIDMGTAKADICDRLWYERNQIYADAGHCFKTARARAVWGRNCFPPYGQLTPRQQRRVNRIMQQEYQNGCK